jgi:hypothetical protein
MSSMPRLLAASISIRSVADDSEIAMQLPQRLQGSPSSGASQLTALARIRAVLVLPVPRMPVKRYAWVRRPETRAFFSVRTVAAWPTRSSNRCER